MAHFYTALYMRECAVRLVENAFELQRCSKLCQSLRDGIKSRPSSSVACIHNYFEWLKSGDINKLANFLDICRAGLFGDVADLPDSGGFIERICFSEFFDARQTTYRIKRC